MAKVSLKKVSKDRKKPQWDASFRDDLYSIPTRNERLRLWEVLVPVHSHYLEFTSKEGARTGFPKLCLAWDPATGEERPGVKCPMCEAGIRVDEYFYGYCFSRKAAKKGNLRIQPIRMTKNLMGDIGQQSYSKYEDMGDDAYEAIDPEHGWDVIVRMEKDGKRTTYKTESGDGFTPLTKEEREAFEEYTEEINIEELAANGCDSEKEILETLKRLQGMGGGSKDKKAKGKSSDDEEIPDDDDGDDDDDAPKKPSKKVAAKKEKVVQKESALDDDEEEGDDEEEEEEAPVAAAKPKSGKKYVATDDEEPEDDDEDDDDDGDDD